MELRPMHEGKDQGRGGASGLFSRLMQRFARLPAGEERDGDREPGGLQPPGRRSGHGTESLAAYLDHTRNTQPGALE